jgi:hypothetical protein
MSKSNICKELAIRAWLDYTCDLHEDKSTIAIKRSKKKEGRG